MNPENDPGEVIKQRIDSDRGKQMVTWRFVTVGPVFVRQHPGNKQLGYAGCRVGNRHEIAQDQGAFGPIRRIRRREDLNSLNPTVSTQRRGGFEKMTTNGGWGLRKWVFLQR